MKINSRCPAAPSPDRMVPGVCSCAGDAAKHLSLTLSERVISRMPGDGTARGCRNSHTEVRALVWPFEAPSSEIVIGEPVMPPSQSRHTKTQVELCPGSVSGFFRTIFHSAESDDGEHEKWLPVTPPPPWRKRPQSGHLPFCSAGDRYPARSIANVPWIHLYRSCNFECKRFMHISSCFVLCVLRIVQS